jgi:hypothetical protein
MAPMSLHGQTARHRTDRAATANVIFGGFALLLAAMAVNYRRSMAASVAPGAPPFASALVSAGIGVYAVAAILQFGVGLTLMARRPREPRGVRSRLRIAMASSIVTAVPGTAAATYSPVLAAQLMLPGSLRPILALAVGVPVALLPLASVWLNWTAVRVIDD